MPCVGAACASLQLIPAGLRALQIPVTAYAGYLVALDACSALAWCLVGAVIFWRRSADRVALFSALTLVTFGAARFPDTPTALAAASPGWALLVHFLRFFGSVCLSLFFYLFPDGRFVPRWTRWAALVWIAVQVPEFFFPDASLNAARFPLPLQVAGFLGFAASVAVAQGYRYRHVSSPMQRQQTKWVIFGMVAALGSYLGLAFVLPLIAPSIDPSGSLGGLAVQTGIVLAMLTVPLTLAIAMLRHQLFDIDRLINRTLVYGLLTVMLAAVYFGGVFSVQTLVQALTGQLALPPIAFVASTLLIAALFQPLRRRVQRAIDHRFYRRRYDAARTLETFGATLREQVDLSQLSEHLLAIVKETMQPAHVSLWLRPLDKRDSPPRADAGRSHGILRVADTDPA
jgi:hypothetical protein